MCRSSLWVTLQPGTPEFQEAFDRITALKNNEGEGGPAFL